METIHHLQGGFSLIFVVIVYCLIFERRQRGVEINPFVYEYGWISIFMLYFCIFSLLITGLIFGRTSLKSLNPKAQIKGKFLIVAFLLFNLGAFLDSLGTLINAIMVVLI